MTNAANAVEIWIYLSYIKTLTEETVSVNILREICAQSMSKDLSNAELMKVTISSFPQR